MTTPNDTTKVCSKCKRELLATPEYFTWDKKQDRPASWCHECNRASVKRWRDAHLEESRAKALQWQRDNPDKVNERSRRYRANNPEKRRETVSRYAETNAEKIREKDRRYRAECADKVRESNRHWVVRNRDKVNATARRYQARNREKAYERNRIRRARELNAPGTFTKADLDLQYQSQNGLCWWCGKQLNGEYHADHMIPLARGGTNWPNNIVCACPSCNLQKHDKLPHEWKGRLF